MSNGGGNLDKMSADNSAITSAEDFPPPPVWRGRVSKMLSNNWEKRKEKNKSRDNLYFSLKSLNFCWCCKIKFFAKRTPLKCFLIVLRSHARWGRMLKLSARARRPKRQCFSILYYVNMSTKSKTDSEFSRVSYGEIPQTAKCARSKENVSVFRYFITSTRVQKVNFLGFPTVKFRKMRQTVSKYFTLVGARFSEKSKRTVFWKR